MRLINYTFIQKHYILVAALVLTLIVYFKTFFFGSISWDDPEMIFKNRDVRALNIKALFTQHYVGNYIPFTMLFHAFCYQIFGTIFWGYRALSIFLHLLNSVLIFVTGKKIFQDEKIATFGAIVFLLHPLQVESVVWIAELKNVLSTTFYFLTLLAYLKFLQDNTAKRYYLFSLLFFVAACLSRSSVVILPLILIAVEVYNQKKFSLKAVYRLLPFFILSLVFGVINLNTQAADLFINQSHQFAWHWRFGLAGLALIHYLLLFIAPFRLSVIYPYPDLKIQALILGIVFLIVIVTGIYLLFKNKKHDWIFLIVFVIVNLVLVLQFIPFGEVLYADRYAYIPIIGFAWMLGILMQRVKGFYTIVSFMLIIILSALTFFRSTKWENALTLYEDILKKYPDQFVALNSAGVECMFLNKDQKALDYFNKAVSVSPNNYKGYYNRGLLMIKNNQPQGAIKTFNQSIALYDYPKAYVGRATAYLMAGDLPKAMNDASYVVSKDDNNAKAHFVLGNCYNETNNLTKALLHYNKCIQLNSEEPDYYFKRAIVYGKNQDFENSLSDLDLCLSMKNNLYEAYFWKGVAKVNLKLNPCEDFKIAAQHHVEPAVSAYYKYCAGQ